MADRQKNGKGFVGRQIAFDPSAESTSPTEPGFIARPKGAPVYHGFQILSDVVVQGFTLGKITDFESEQSNEGDCFVIAPDNSRCGLVWEVSDKSCRLRRSTQHLLGVYSLEFEILEFFLDVDSIAARPYRDSVASSDDNFRVTDN